MKIRTFFFLLGVLTFGSLLSGCNDNSSDTVDTVTLTGVVYPPPAGDAQISVKTPGGDMIADPVNLDSSGNYAIKIDKNFLSDALIVESSAITRSSSEETETPTGSAGLAVFLPPSRLNTDTMANLTPGTTIIRDLITRHGKTRQEAEKIFKDIFDYLPDISVIPRPDSSKADEFLAAVRADAFRELTTELGLMNSQLLDLLLAIATDLADSKADGRDINGLIIDIGSTGKQLPEEIQNILALIFARLFTSNNNVMEPAIKKTNATSQNNNETPIASRPIVLAFSYAG